MQWDDLKNRREEFDQELPELGHQDRFERRLEESFGQKKNGTFVWLRVAAVFVAILGCLWFLKTPESNTAMAEETTQEKGEELLTEEVEYYYQNSFSEQFKRLAQENTSPESKKMIEETNVLIENLDKEYKDLATQLEKTGDQRVAVAMINNYKNRINILEALIQKIKYVNQLKEENDENVPA